MALIQVLNGIISLKFLSLRENKFLKFKQCVVIILHCSIKN